MPSNIPTPMISDQYGGLRDTVPIGTCCRTKLHFFILIFLLSSSTLVPAYPLTRVSPLKPLSCPEMMVPLSRAAKKVSSTVGKTNGSPPQKTKTLPSQPKSHLHWREQCGKNWVAKEKVINIFFSAFFGYRTPTTPTLLHPHRPHKARDGGRGELHRRLATRLAAVAAAQLQHRPGAVWHSAPR